MKLAQTVADGNEYRKRVLASAATSNEIPDVFARYGLAADEADPDVIARQLKATLAIWNKETGHPKYGMLVRRLIKEHPQATRVLTNRVLRERERQEVCRRTQADAAKRHEPLEAQLTELIKRHGGVPRSHVADLIQFGAASGLTEDEVRVRLEQERLVDDIGATRPMLAPATFAEIQRRLAEHQTAAGGSPEDANLFSFLGAPFNAPAHDLRRRYEEHVTRNDERAFGDEKTLASRVLVNVRRHLLDADPEPYRNSVMRAVKDRLLPAIESHKLMNGNLTREAVAELEQLAVERGLDAGRAAAAVLELAREKRVPIVAPPTPEPRSSPRPPPSAGGERRGPPKPIDLLPPRPPSPPPRPPDPPPVERPHHWPPPVQRPPYHPPPVQRPPRQPTPVQQGSDQQDVVDRQPFRQAAQVALENPVKYALLGRRQNVTSEDLSIAAHVWFAYALVPLVGPGLSWFMAALLTGSRRMFAWSGFYWGFPILFLPNGADEVLGMFIILWLGGMVHTYCVRERVSRAIRSRDQRP